MDGSGSGIGWDLCAGLFYEHRFAMLINMNIMKVPSYRILCLSVKKDANRNWRS